MLWKLLYLVSQARRKQKSQYIYFKDAFLGTQVLPAQFFHPKNYFPDEALAGRQANIIGKNLQNMGERKGE